jgi:hypothetical protein
MERGTRLRVEGLADKPSAVPVFCQARPLTCEPAKVGGHLLREVTACLARRGARAFAEAGKPRADGREREDVQGVNGELLGSQVADLPEALRAASRRASRLKGYRFEQRRLKLSVSVGLSELEKERIPWARASLRPPPGQGPVELFAERW